MGWTLPFMAFLSIPHVPIVRGPVSGRRASRIGTESVDGLPTPKVMLKSNETARALALSQHIESGTNSLAFA